MADDIASNVAVLTQRLTDHTAQDEDNFERMFAQLTEIDGKMDKLLLREATRTGAATGARKSALIIAAIVSTFISAVGWAAPYLVGN